MRRECCVVSHATDGRIHEVLTTLSTKLHLKLVILSEIPTVMMLDNASCDSLAEYLTQTADEILGRNRTILILVLCVPESRIDIQLDKWAELFLTESLSRANSCQ